VIHHAHYKIQYQRYLQVVKIQDLQVYLHTVAEATDPFVPVSRPAGEVHQYLTALTVAASVNGVRYEVPAAVSTVCSTLVALATATRADDFRGVPNTGHILALDCVTDLEGLPPGASLYGGGQLFDAQLDNRVVLRPHERGFRSGPRAACALNLGTYAHVGIAYLVRQLWRTPHGGHTGDHIFWFRCSGCGGSGGETVWTDPVPFRNQCQWRV
jgi:hypothetical protein